MNEAKLAVSRDVAIDLPAGPSEVVVLLGRGGDRRIAELEIAAQAEHGHDASAARRGGDDLEAALAEVERIAPEHLVLLGEAEALADRVRNAGAVFVGESRPVPPATTAPARITSCPRTAGRGPSAASGSRRSSSR